MKLTRDQRRSYLPSNLIVMASSSTSLQSLRNARNSRTVLWYSEFSLVPSFISTLFSSSTSRSSLLICDQSKSKIKMERTKCIGSIIINVNPDIKSEPSFRAVKSKKLEIVHNATNVKLLSPQSQAQGSQKNYSETISLANSISAMSIK